METHKPSTNTIERHFPNYPNKFTLQKKFTKQSNPVNKNFRKTNGGFEIHTSPKTKPYNTRP